MFTEAKRQYAAKLLGLGDDFRFALVMTNNTLLADRDALNLGAITTLDECDGAGYARVALANEAVAADNPNDRALFDADDVTFPGLGPGTRPNAGVLLYKHVGADAVNIPVAFYDPAPFPVNGNGLDFLVRVNALGLLAFT